THKRIAITKNVLNKKHKDEVFSQENELTSLESNKAEISEVKEESFTAPYPQAGFFRPVAEEPVTLHVPGSTHDDSLRKLFGKNHPQNIQLIDFDDSIRLEENRKWLQLHGHEKPKAPLSVMLSVGSGIQKRKHQITFLASQAKRNAEALEEHWASCRSKQRAGRSTYGFM
ncbi:uncharacterized protein LOC135144917, partial [Zophobas morio]|uniref:uncharacterized protein LOC135144917 n=1 Tax=Zophobas morio TaxID=2755281 RepID=UPI003083BAA6